MVRYDNSHFGGMPNQSQGMPNNANNGVILPIQPNPSLMAADPSKVREMQRLMASPYPTASNQPPKVMSAYDAHAAKQSAPMAQPNAMQPNMAVNNETFNEPAHEQKAPNTAISPNSDMFVSQHKSGFVSLPESIEQCQEFAKYISASMVIPPCIRNKPETVYMLLSRAVSNGISWANMFSSLFVIPDKSGNITVGMYVNAKAAMCISKGQWEVTLDFQTGDATAKGKRYDSNQELSVTYTAYEASLTGKLTHDASGAIVGVDKWATRWPDMMKKRALGRLLDALFPDVVGGFMSKEDYDDQAYAEQLQAADKDNSTDALSAITKVRKSRGKAKAKDEDLALSGSLEPMEEPAKKGPRIPLSEMPVIDEPLEPETLNNPLS